MEKHCPSLNKHYAASPPLTKKKNTPGERGRRPPDALFPSPSVSPPPLSSSLCSVYLFFNCSLSHPSLSISTFHRFSSCFLSPSVSSWSNCQSSASNKTPHYDRSFSLALHHCLTNLVCNLPSQMSNIYSFQPLQCEAFCFYFIINWISLSLDSCSDKSKKL